MALALADDGSLFVADAETATVYHWSSSTCVPLGSGALSRPTGLALAPDRLWVVDPPAHTLLALSPSGDVLARVGQLGEGEGQFHFPTSIARAKDGTLFVVDSLNFRVVRLAPDGRWLGTFGSAGDAGPAFSRPKAVAVSGDAVVFVSDAQRDVVLAFSPSGELRYSIGASGSTPGHFVLPAGLDVRGGQLAVADSQNRRVQVFEILKESR
jgi:sugar lactone lactonase YvrE